MKKTAAFMAALLLFAGCAQDTRPVDERYIDSLTTALKSRWETDPSSAVYGNNGIPVDSASFKKAIDEEIKELEPYADETFENEELQKAADSYLDSLKEMQNISKYYTADPARFFNQYEDLMDESSMTISEINSISPLEFTSEEDQVRMEMTLEKAQILEFVKDLPSKIKFEQIDGYDEPGSYYAELQAKVDNTTDFEFSNFYVDVNFLDENGTVVRSSTADISTWKPGEQQTLDIYTGEKYSKLQITNISTSVMDRNLYVDMPFDSAD